MKGLKNGIHTLQFFYEHCKTCDTSGGVSEVFLCFIKKMA
jgi:hypothetical protein